MRKTMAALFAALLLLTGCGGDTESTDSGPDIAKCEDAMRAQFEEAMTEGTEGTEPPECDGVSQADLERIAEDILGDALTE